MNTICCNNCKISINYNNGISYQSHYLSVSVSFPRNVHALALKCQNIPQKSQVRNCFSPDKNNWKKFAVLLSRTVYTIIGALHYPKYTSTLLPLATDLWRFCWYKVARQDTSVLQKFLTKWNYQHNQKVRLACSYQ